MNVFFVFLIICFIVMIGHVAIKIFHLLENYSFLQALPYSFGSGVGFIAMQMYIYSRVGIEWNRIFLLLPWLLIACFYFFKNKKFLNTDYKIPHIYLIDKTLIVSILLLLLFVGFETIIRPLFAWDGWATWLLRAKILYFDGKISGMVFQNVQSDYPLVISLVSAFIYSILGMVDDKAVLLFFYSFYVLLGVQFFLFLKKRTSARIGLLGTFLLLSTQNLIRHGGRYEVGQADLALGFFIFCCFTLLVNYMKNHKLKTILFLNIFLAITSMIKNEGIPFAFLVELICIYSIFKSKKYFHLYVISFFIVPFLDWQLFKFMIHAPSFPSYVGIPHLDRMGLVFIEMTKEFLNMKNWNLLWICFGIGIPLNFVLKRDKEIYIIYLLIFIQLVSYGFIFLGTLTDPVLHIRNTIDRLFLHIAPLAVFTIMLLFNKGLRVLNYGISK